ncbi:MAG: chorismate mutase, partial [Elusimicrobiota bacterium]
MELGKFRKKIDNIDSQILELLNQRAVIVKQVGKHKQAKNIPYFVPERERQILDKLEAQNTGPLNNEAVREVFIQVLSICR